MKLLLLIIAMVITQYSVTLHATAELPPIPNVIGQKVDWMVKRITASNSGSGTHDAAFEENKFGLNSVTGKAIYRDGIIQIRGRSCLQKKCTSYKEVLQVLEIATSGLRAEVIDRSKFRNNRIDTVYILPFEGGFYLYVALPHPITVQTKMYKLVTPTPEELASHLGRF